VHGAGAGGLQAQRGRRCAQLRCCQTQDHHRRRGDIVVTSIDRQLVDPVTLLDVKTIGLLNQTGDDRAQVIAPGGQPDLFDRQPLTPLAFRAPRRADDVLIGPVVAQQRLQPVDAVKNPLLANTDLGAELGQE